MLEPRRTLPAAGIASPASTLARVVLPAPFRPTRPTLSPGAIWKLASASSSCAPARSSRPVAAITWHHSKRGSGKKRHGRGPYPGYLAPGYPCPATGAAGAGDLGAAAIVIPISPFTADGLERTPVRRRR